MSAVMVAPSVGAAATMVALLCAIRAGRGASTEASKRDDRQGLPDQP